MSAAAAREPDAKSHPDDAKDDHDATVEDDLSSNSDASGPTPQAGVKTIEAIGQAWTVWALVVAYLGLYLMVVATSLEGQTTIYLTAYATSAFKSHSLLATVLVVQEVFLAVIKPPMAKLSDVVGRLEAFCLSILLYTLGYIQLAASNNISTYAAAQLFYSAGSTGLQILQQIFIADTTDLTWRALFSSFPDLPFLFTTWVGPILSQDFIDGPGWRWGYGVWAIILPACFLPLALSLFVNKRKAKKLGLLPPPQFKGKSVFEILRTLWFELDFFGLVLLCAFISLILIPLTIAANQRNGWSSGNIIAMLTVGGVCLVLYPFWERSNTLAPRAFFPRDLFKSRTVSAGCAIGFFYFMAYYLSVQPYFYSYLQVVQRDSIVAAGHITSTFSFTSSVTAVIVSILIKYTGHYKYFLVFGTCMYTVAFGLMIVYRKPITSTGSIVGTQIAVGIGGGMINAPAQLGVQASASHTQVAAATAVYLTIVEIGGAVGSAISGAIWTNNILPRLERYLPADTQDQAAAIYGNLTLAAHGWPEGSPTRNAIERAYQETMNILLIVAICVSAVMIPISLCMKNYKLAKIDQKVKGLVIGGKKNTNGVSEGQSEPS